MTVNHERGPRRSAVRWALIILAILLISYVPAMGLLRGISHHGEPDPTPRPWPLQSWPPPGAQKSGG